MSQWPFVRLFCEFMWLWMVACSLTGSDWSAVLICMDRCFFLESFVIQSVWWMYLMEVMNLTKSIMFLIISFIIIWYCQIWPKPSKNPKAYLSLINSLILYMWSLCCVFKGWFVYIIVCVCACSVWDALTDNYLPSSVSSWDGPNSETLNGNLSDDEVSKLFLWSFLLTKY